MRVEDKDMGCHLIEESNCMEGRLREAFQFANGGSTAGKASAFL